MGLIGQHNTRELAAITLRVGSSGLEVAAMVVMARSLSPAGFGQLSAAIVVVRLLALFSDSGVAFSGTRDVARFGWQSPLIWWWQARRRQRSLILATAYLVVCWVLGRPELGPLALVLIARGANRDWIGLGRRRPAAAAVAPLASAIIVAAGVFVVDSAAEGAILLSVGAVAWIATSRVLNPCPAFNSDGAEEAVAWHRAHTRATSWALVVLFADQIIQSFDILLLAALRSDTEAGIYAAVYRIPNALLLLSGLAITTTTPRLVEKLASGATPAVLRRSCDRLGYALVCGVAVAGVGAVGLVEPIFGAAYTSGRGPLLLLMVATALNIGSAPLRAFQLTSGRDKAVARVAVANAMVSVAAGVVFIPLFGMMAAAAITAVAQLAFYGFFVADTRDDDNWVSPTAPAVSLPPEAVSLPPEAVSLPPEAVARRLSR